MKIDWNSALIGAALGSGVVGLLWSIAFERLRKRYVDLVAGMLERK